MLTVKTTEKNETYKFALSSKKNEIMLTISPLRVGRKTSTIKKQQISIGTGRMPTIGTPPPGQQRTRDMWEVMRVITSPWLCTVFITLSHTRQQSFAASTG